MKLRIIVLVALAAALMVPALACGGKKKETTAEATRPAATSAPSGAGVQATTRPATTAPSTGGGCESELAALEQAMKNVKSFRANMTMDVPGAGTQTGVLEYVAPDRSHISLAGLEFISIGNDVYTKIGPTWQKSAGTSGIDTKSLSDSFSGIQCSGLTKGGTETINGQRCQVYSYTSAGANVQLCAANNLPVRVTTTSGGTKVTIDFTNINGNIDIKAPI